MITLYDYVLSANCYKVRLLLGLLDVEYGCEIVDVHPGGEHRGEAFRQITPIREVPVLDDDGVRFIEAHAILAYLASKYDTTSRWFPVDDPATLGETTQWLSFADRTATSAAAARAHTNFGVACDIERVRATAHELFAVADEHLWFREREDMQWFGGGNHPTIADIAIFPDVMLASEGGIDLLDYPALVRWTDRVKKLNGFTTMPGVFPAERS